MNRKVVFFCACCASLIALVSCSSVKPIAEMSGDVKGEGAQILTELDAVGNTTKAITKGIAIATAVLAATALFGSFTDAVATVLKENYAKFELASVVFSPVVLVGVILGIYL